MRDRETNLQKKDVRLAVNGRLVNFNYNAANDRLMRQPRLLAGTHQVRVVATDEGGVRTAATWGFAISNAAAPRPGQSVSQSASINQSRSNIRQSR